MVREVRARDELKILLLQFRVAEEMRQQELECFLKFSGLKPGQIKAHYLLEDEFDIDDLGKYDAVIIGGTGDFGAYDIKSKYESQYRKLEEIGLRCREEGIPTLSVCLQVWADIFGGEVKTDESRQEVGTFTIKLTDEAKQDRLFRDMPREFKAQAGHKDYISKLPKGAVLLAYSDLCPTHAYRVGDREYVLQFHVDLDMKRLIERIKFYGPKGYAPNEGTPEFKKLIDGIEETPESNGLLRKWVDRIVLGLD